MVTASKLIGFEGQERSMSALSAILDADAGISRLWSTWPPAPARSAGQQASRRWWLRNPRGRLVLRLGIAQAEPNRPVRGAETGDFRADN